MNGNQWWHPMDGFELKTPQMGFHGHGVITCNYPNSWIINGWKIHLNIHHWKSIYEWIYRWISFPSINGWILPNWGSHGVPHSVPQKKHKTSAGHVAARWPRHCASCCLCCSPPGLWRLLSSRALGRRPGGPLLVEVKHWGNPWEIQEKYMGKLMGKIRIMMNQYESCPIFGFVADRISYHLRDLLGDKIW